MKSVLHELCIQSLMIVWLNEVWPHYFKDEFSAFRLFFLKWGFNLIITQMISKPKCGTAYNVHQSNLVSPMQDIAKCLQDLYILPFYLFILLSSYFSSSFFLVLYIFVHCSNPFQPYFSRHRGPKWPEWKSCRPRKEVNFYRPRYNVLIKSLRSGLGSNLVAQHKLATF